MVGPDSGKHQPSGPASADASSATEPGTVDQSASSQQDRLATHRRLLWLTVGVSAVWWLSLGSLAWRTANPVTFNLLQLRATDVVVSARIEDPQQGQVQVLHTWEFFPRTPEDATVALSLKVEGLADLQLPRGSQFLIPLRRSVEGQLEVAPAVRPRGEQRQTAKPQRYVYPDTESSRRLLEEARERLFTQARG